MRSYLFLLVFCITYSFSQIAIQYYDFEDNNNRGGAIETTPEIIINPVSNSNVTPNAGRSFSRVSGVPTTGSAISRGNWQVSLSDPGTSASEYIQFSVNTDGFKQISVMVDARDLGATATITIGLLYSTNGGASFSTAGTRALSTSWGTFIWDLSSITALDDNQNVVFRIYGYTSSLLASAAFDNLTVRAVTITKSKTLGDYSKILAAKGSFPVDTNLTINGTGISVTLASNLRLKGTLTLTNGKIFTTDNFKIEMLAGSSISGGSEQSYVVGSIQHDFTGSITPKFYPVGSTTAYRPARAFPTGMQSPPFIVTCKVVEPNPTPTSIPTGVTHISPVRYWRFTFGTQNNVNLDTPLYIWLSWGSDDGVTDTAKVTIAMGQAGGDWTRIATNRGTLSGSQPSPGKGTLFSEFKQTFTINANESWDFTFANLTGGDNSLPVQISRIIARTYNNSIVIEWETKTEVDISGFEVFRSETGLPGSFKLISSYLTNDSLKAKGFSSFGAKYTFVDVGVRPGSVYYYTIEAVNKDGRREKIGEISVSLEIPSKFALYQNYPNPFNPITTIEFDIPEKVRTELIIYDVLGKTVATLINEELEPGRYRINFNSGEIPSGVYFYTLKAGKFSQTRKMILTK